MSYINKKRFSDIAEKLIRKAGSRNPFEIAEALGIDVRFCENFGNLKGMYTVIKKNRYIFINNEIDERTKQIVCSHELGHDQLHRHLATLGPLKEFMIYQMNSTPEYEANIVAAEILLDTDEILEYIYQYNYSDVQIADALQTDVNLVALKTGYLRELGFDLKPLEYRSDFLR